MLETPVAPQPDAPIAPPAPPSEAELAKAKAEALLNDKYFARKPREEIGKTLLGIADTYYSRISELGKVRLWKRAYEYYYRGEIRSAQLKRVGKQNEYILMPANHYRNILKHLLNAVTSQRPEPDPQAQNTDFDSMAQTIVSRGVIKFYDREKHLERYTKKGAEMSLVYGESYLEETWDASGGRDYMVDVSGKGTVKEGDLYFCNLGPMDVIRDTTRDSSLGHEWLMVRKFVNKFTMAAKYPQFADKILSMTYDPKDRRGVRFGQISDKDTDLVAVWTFYHDKTAAMPDGRVVEFLGPDVVTIDGPLPYRRIPVYRIAPDEKDGTTFGYTIGFDLLPIQEAIDGLYSTIVTNQSNFGVQNIAMPKQSNLTVTQIADGLNLIEYSIVGNVPMKPEGLNLTNTPAEIFKFIEQLERLMETISGVNATVRGNPEASLKSGASLALVASMAIQFNSEFQQSYAQLLEDTWTGIIEILQDFSNTPRMARITGKANRPLMSSFTKDNINKIQRVSVNITNSVMGTTAGKLQVAEDLLSKGLIKTPDEYITILQTGRLEPLIEGQQSQLLLIRAENERLGDEKEQVTQGQPMVDPTTGQMVPGQDISSVPVILTDDHVLHIQEHQTVLASPEARMNPNVVKNSLAHIHEHITQLMSGDPVLQLLGQPSLMPPPPLDGGGAPPKGPKKSTAPGAVDATNPATKEAQQINLPNMPKNPLNGQKFDPTAAPAGA